MAEETELARLEALIEGAFGPLPIPPRETILGWMLESAGEAEWILAAFDGRRYSDVEPRLLDSLFLTHVLSPSAFAYYVGSAALAAARWPTERQDALVACFAYDETPEDALPEDYAQLDLPRTGAIRETLAYVREQMLRQERAFWEGKDPFFRSETEEEHVAMVSKAQGTIERIERILGGIRPSDPPRHEP